MDYNIQLYEKLYSKIATALGINTPIDEVKLGEPLLSLYNPGQYIPTGLSPETKPEDNRRISQMFDTASRFDTTYSPVALPVSVAYKNILDYKLFPLATITKEQQLKLEQAIVSYNSSKDRCDAAMYRYLYASDVLNEAIISHENDHSKPMPSSRIKMQAKAAMDTWIAAGKVKQEFNIAVIAQYQAMEGASFWQKLQDQFDSNQAKLENGIQFSPVTMTPSYKNWHKEEGWIKFEFNQKDMDNQRTCISIYEAGTLDPNYGIMYINGKDSWHNGYTKIQETNLTIKCELMRVTLTRPWMNPLLFNSKAWKFAQNAPAAKYSSGGSIYEGIKPTGSFVTLPTTYILARNVEIFGIFGDTLEETLRTNVEASATVGIGPFSISGKVIYGDTEEKIKGSITKNSIKIDNIQVIASISQILPKLPNPDPNLSWPQ